MEISKLVDAMYVSKKGTIIDTVGDVVTVHAMYNELKMAHDNLIQLFFYDNSLYHYSVEGMKFIKDGELIPAISFYEYHEDHGDNTACVIQSYVNIPLVDKKFKDIVVMECRIVNQTISNIDFKHNNKYDIIKCLPKTHMLMDLPSDMCILFDDCGYDVSDGEATYNGELRGYVVENDDGYLVTVANSKYAASITLRCNVDTIHEIDVGESVSLEK